MKKNIGFLRRVSYLRLFFLASGILLTYKILFDFDSMIVLINQVARVINPFLVGFIIAYCVNVPCCRLENRLLSVKMKWIRKMARPFSILVVYSVIRTDTHEIVDITPIYPL